MARILIHFVCMDNASDSVTSADAAISADVAAESTSFQKASFLIYLLLVTAAFLYLVGKFLMPLLLAAVFTALTYPIYRILLARLRIPVIAALTTLVSVLLVLVLPIIAVGAVAYQEAVGFITHLNIDAWRDRLIAIAEGLRGRFPTLLQRVHPENLTGMAISGLQNALQFILKHSADISLSVAGNLLSFFLMLFIMFYFYMDGYRILERVIRWSPLKDEYERVLIEKFVSVSKGTLKGILAVAMLQGVLGAILFWLVGMTSPIFMGVLMVFAGIIPAVGTALIWLPTAIVLLTEGRWGAALATVIVGAGVIGMVDNFVRPVLVGKDIKMHDLLVLLSTLGGIGIFGLPGLIIGPIIAALFLAIWNIYEEVFAVELAANSVSGFKTRKIASLMKANAPSAPAPASEKPAPPKGRKKKR